MNETLNFIMDHWETISGAVCLIGGMVFGSAKIAKAKKLITTLKEALGDKHLTEEEVKKIKEDFDALLK